MENALTKCCLSRNQAPEHCARHAWVVSGSARLSRRQNAIAEQVSDLRREHEGLRRALYEAAQLQRRLCGPRVLRRGVFEIASEIFPVRDLSGDFTCVFEQGSKVVFAIGDIAGKGLSAGMWFTHLLGMVRLQMEALADPAAALAAINRDLLFTRLESPLTTIFLGQLDLRSGEVAYCSAGHPPAVILRNDDTVENLDEGGPVLGALQEARFLNGVTSLGPGDTLMGYSDGIAECRSHEGVEFGAEGIMAVARSSHGSTASGTLFSILGAAEDFAGGNSREDDMALIVVRRACE